MKFSVYENFASIHAAAEKSFILHIQACQPYSIITPKKDTNVKQVPVRENSRLNRETGKSRCGPATVIGLCAKSQDTCLFDKHEVCEDR